MTMGTSSDACMCTSVHIFYSFFKWVVFLFLNLSSLYALDTSPLSNMYLANISFLSVACLYILLTVPFREKFLLLMKYNYLFNL